MKRRPEGKPPYPTPNDPREAPDPGPPSPSPSVPRPPEPRPAERSPERPSLSPEGKKEPTANRLRADERRVLDALQRSRRVSDRKIGVRRRGSRLQLQGEVHSFRQKREAERLARRESRATVENGLRVDYPSRVSDQQVARGVRRALRESGLVDASTVTVYAKGRKIVLRGTVISAEQQQLVMNLALGVPGVRTVLNLVRIDDREQRIDGHAARSILDRLQRHRELPDEGLHVAVSAGTAVLSGEVQSKRERRLAGHIANEFPITRIRNRIRVSAAS